MNCKRCGAELKSKGDRCSVCGAINGESSRITRDLSDFTEEYGLNPPEPDKEPVPQIFGDVRLEHDIVKIQKEADYSISDAKKPSIEMETYIKLMGEDSAEKREEADPQPQNLEKPSDIESGKLLGELKQAYSKADELVSPKLEKVVKLYRDKVPQLKRAKVNAKKERITALAAILAGIVIVIVLSAVIASRIPPSVKGEWLVGSTASGDMLTVEFTAGGKVIARTYIDGEANIYRTGTYKARKRNDYNLLIIEYEDGEQSRLYYEPERNGMSFTNVDSNARASYSKL